MALFNMLQDVCKSPIAQVVGVENNVAEITEEVKTPKYPKPDISQMLPFKPRLIMDPG